MKVNSSAYRLKPPHGHQINNTDRHAFLQQRRALGDKDVAVFGSVLVRWTDDLDGRDQMSAAFRVVDLNRVLIVIRQRRFHGDAGPWRRPNGRRHAAVSLAHRGLRSGVVFLKCGNVDFNLANPK